MNLKVLALARLVFSFPCLTGSVNTGCALRGSGGGGGQSKYESGEEFLQTAVGGWNDPDIIHESRDHKWHRIPEPFFRPEDSRPHSFRRDYKDSAVANTSSIVVLIAALREPRAVQSLLSLFSNADLAERIHVGVVQQNEEADVDVLKGLCDRLGTPLHLTKEWRDKTGSSEASHRRADGDDDWGQDRFTQESLAACAPARRVRVYRMHANEAAGPVFARSHQPLLLSQGDNMEDFCLQIDAHTIFTKGWDTMLLQQWASLANDYAVITTYPTGASLLENGDVPNINNHWEMPHLCQASILSEGIVRNAQAAAAANLRTPPLSKFWAAGLSFSRCHAERDVPADPKLKQVFNGEEFSRGARLWTNGYDFYSLARPVLGTYYGNDKGGLGGWTEKFAEKQVANQRLAALLASDPAAPRASELAGYDIGNRRRLQDYFALTGVDTHKGHVNSTPCMVTKWTKWLEGSDPPYQPTRVAPPPMAARLHETSVQQEV